MKCAFSRLLFLSIALLAGMASGLAQDWEDDIYFDAAKAAKKEAAKKEARRKATIASYPAADTYSSVSTSNTRDIDEYNRRGIFAINDSASRQATDSLAAGDAFANTRRIERFYNPDVIVENPDASVAEYYYSSQPANVNIYVNSAYPYYSPFYDPWYYNSWGWGPAWSWTWGPSWSLGWGWAGPSWSWGWAG
ncbi:MAG: hypothetical protein NC342_06635, partial [Pseudoflavonifractor sp.]|nr:hypothetical protein [Pseudoflavonifractor sp.]